MELTEEVQESLEFWSVLDSSFLMLSLVLNDDLDSVIKKSRWYLVHVVCQAKHTFLMSIRFLQRRWHGGVFTIHNGIPFKFDLKILKLYLENLVRKCVSHFDRQCARFQAI